MMMSYDMNFNRFTTFKTYVEFRMHSIFHAAFGRSKAAVFHDDFSCFIRCYFLGEIPRLCGEIGFRLDTIKQHISFCDEVSKTTFN